LQAFPDGNHRTALYVVELFLKKNCYCFNYTPEEPYEFRKELYTAATKPMRKDLQAF
jgi:prophage maintenance system killer protein